MKFSLMTTALLLLSTQTFAKIIESNGSFYIRTKGKQEPIHLLNSMIKNKSVSKVRLYNSGEIHMVSFSKDGGEEKNYSVDEKGYIYAIEPFSSYKVNSVDQKGYVSFKEAPNKKYFINQKGFFLY